MNGKVLYLFVTCLTSERGDLENVGPEYLQIRHTAANKLQYASQDQGNTKMARGASEDHTSNGRSL